MKSYYYIMGKHPNQKLLWHQMKRSVPVTGLIFSGYWPKGSHSPTQISQTISRAVGYPPQVDSKALLLKIITYLCHRTFPLNI